MIKLDAGHRGEQFGGQMPLAGGADRGVAQCPRLGFGQCNQLGNVFGGNLGMDDQHIGRDADDGYRREVLDRIVEAISH